MPHSLEVSKIEPSFGGSGYSARALAYGQYGLKLSTQPLNLDLVRVVHISNLSICNYGSDPMNYGYWKIS